MGQFVKGQSGNPKGRPRKGQTFADALRAALAVRDPQTKQTELHKVAQAIVSKAKAGDVPAIAFIAERLDGKVPDEVAASGALTIRVEYADGHADAP